MAIEAALDKEGDVKWREFLSSHQSKLSLLACSYPLL